MSRVWRGLVRAVVGVVSLALILVAAIYGASEIKLRHHYALPAHPAFVAPVNVDAATIERGRHLAGPIAKCFECHGDDLSGRVFIDDPAFGRFAAPNLTRGAGGLGASLTDADYELAIRHGMDRQGRSVLFMPSQDFNRLSDEDLAAVIAYVKQVPPVDHTVPATRVGPLGRVLLLAGKVPLLDPAGTTPQQRPHTPAPPVGPTAPYGAYLAQVGGCAGCHRENFEGGPIPGAPPNVKPAANLTPTGIGTWPESDFVRVLREGVGPGGVPVDTFMPFRLTKGMTDTQIDALWTYLKTLPPEPMGK